MYLYGWIANCMNGLHKNKIINILLSQKYFTVNFLYEIKCKMLQEEQTATWQVDRTWKSKKEDVKGQNRLNHVRRGLLGAYPMELRRQPSPPVFRVWEIVILNIKEFVINMQEEIWVAVWPDIRPVRKMCELSLT